MQAILAFELPEEREDFTAAINGPKALSVLWDLDMWLRSKIKHGDHDELQPAKDCLWELVQEYGVDLT